MERCANVMRFGRMTTNTESALNREEFTRHVRMYRRFAMGRRTLCGALARHTAIDLLFLRSCIK
jgi:hypothetical protein